MGAVTDKYNNLVQEKNNIVKRLKELEKDEKVKEYIELNERNDKLYNQLISSYKGLKLENYYNCKHIFVKSSTIYESIEGRSYSYYGCIKCGLANNVLDENKNNLTEDEKIMYEFLDKNSMKGIFVKESCDLSLAKAIYNKIIDNYPNIDDHTAVTYFKKALYDIRNVKVSNERKENRAKRLSLHANFNKWYGADITKWQ